MKGLWKRLAGGLEKTRTRLADGIDDLLRRGSKLDDGFYEELEEILLAADVGPDLSREIVESLKSRARGRRIEDSQGLRPLMAEIVLEILRNAGTAGGTIPAPDPGALHVVSLVGVNGAGKTTSLAKLAHKYRGEGHTPIIVASDTFRAAASEQLEIWAQRAGVQVIRSQTGADPGAVAFDGIQAARSRGATAVFVDTAGRLQTNQNLMAELEKIHRVLGKACPGAPHEVLLVLDAALGQNGLSQARSFLGAVGVTGLILTKLDGSAKGGAILPIARDLGTPVLWVGLGERLEDLDPFDAEGFADALLRPTAT